MAVSTTRRHIFLCLKICTDLKKRHLSSFKHKPAIYYFPNTSPAIHDHDKVKHLLNERSHLVELKSVTEFGIRNLKGRKARRPELSDLLAGRQSKEADKYFKGGRMYKIQSELAENALDLLRLVCDVHPGYILDLGCGSGISTKVIAERGHIPVSIDINPAMLKCMAEQNDTPDDAILGNVSMGLPFRSGVFDAAVSISFLQWLIVDERNEILRIFFNSLKFCLADKGSAVFQFYPRTLADVERTIETASLFFRGFIIGDHPHENRGKKLFMILFSL